MKYSKLFLSFVVMGFLLSTSPVRALTSNTTVTSNAPSFRVAGGILFDKFGEIISKLNMAQNKVSYAIERLKADGKDTTKAQAALDLSVKKLGDAKVKLDVTRKLLPSPVPMGDDKIPTATLVKIRLGVKEAKELLKNSREALLQSISEIKTLRGESTN